MTKVFNFGEVNPIAKKQRIKEIIMALSPEKQRILKEKTDNEKVLEITGEINLIFDSLYSYKYEGFRYLFGELYENCDLNDRVRITILIWDALDVIDSQDKNIIIDVIKSMSLEEVSNKYGISVNEVLMSLNDTLGYIKHINYIMLQNGKKNQRIESVYITLGEYSREDVDWAISKLSLAHKKIIYAVHGLNLQEPQKVNIDNVPYTTYVMHILPVLSGLLAKKNCKVEMKNSLKVAQIKPIKNEND